MNKKMDLNFIHYLFTSLKLINVPQEEKRQNITQTWGHTTPFQILYIALECTNDIENQVCM